MAAGTDSRKSRKSESQNEEEEEMDLEEEPNFSDPEDFVDDITDEGNLLCGSTFIPLCDMCHCICRLHLFSVSSRDWAFFPGQHEDSDLVKVSFHDHILI